MSSLTRQVRMQKIKFLSQNVSIVQPITPEFLFLFFCIALLPFGGLWFQSSDASALLYAIFKLHSLVLHEGQIISE